MDEEIKPRFTGWMKEENQSLNFGGESKPRFTGLMKKTKVYRLNEEKDQCLQVGRRLD